MKKRNATKKSPKKIAKEISNRLETKKGLESIERYLRKADKEIARLQEARKITREMWHDPVTI